MISSITTSISLLLWSSWLKSGCQISNFSTVESNPEQVSPSWIPYIEYHQGVQLWRMRTGDRERRVEVRKQEPLRLAYIRYTGPYKGDGQLFQKLWTTLCTRAGAMDLIDESSLYLSLYHDNPDLTDDEKLRMTIALSTGKDFTPGEKLGRMELEGGKYAFARFRLNSTEYQEAWDWVYRDWLPVSGYYPDERPAFELYPRDEDKSNDGLYTPLRNHIKKDPMRWVSLPQDHP